MNNTLFPTGPAITGDPSMRCHRSDPPTSREAAERVEATGTAADHRARILAVIRERPGLTGSEIGQRCGLSQAQVGRRISEIPEIEAGYPRVCAVRGSKCMTWRVRQ